MSVLFDELSRRLDAIAEAARRVIKAEQEQRKLGIPGQAAWNGYTASGQATVKKNGQVLNVTTTSKLSIPIGTSVYVDETLTVDYKQRKPEKEQKKPPAPEVQNVKRVKKNRRPTLPVSPILEDIKGATWLVYHEYLKPLEWQTDSRIGTNPPGVPWSLFLTLYPLAFLGGGVILGVIYWTLFQFNIEPLDPLPLRDLKTPNNHPEKPSDIDASEYNYFIILQAVVDQLFTSSGLLAYPPSLGDGLWLGINNAIGNSLFIIGGLYQASIESSVKSALSFSEKFLLKPWALSFDDKLQAVLTHFGPGKVQAALYRIVGVYPAKKFKINITSWEVPDIGIGDDFDPEVDSSVFRRRHKQFVIPDDIPNWNNLLGNGSVDTGPNRQNSELYPYEIVPAHNYYESLGENDPFEANDLTKFASYSTNSIFLNYVIKTYAPWTNLDDTLRINYYLLTLQATNVPNTDTIAIRHRITASTFNLPPEIRVGGDIAAEDPNFPLQSGEKRVMTRKITYTLVGKDDAAQPAILPISFSVVKGDAGKTGFLPFLDPDWSVIQGPKSFQFSQYGSLPDDQIEFYKGTNELRKSVGLPPIVPEQFQIQGAPPGFKVDPKTGQYIMEPNVQDLAALEQGWSAKFAFEYSVLSNNQTIANSIEITVIGSDSDIVVETPPDFPDQPYLGPDLDEFTPTTAPVSNPWDPEPVFESDQIAEEQTFTKIRSEIPFPEVNEDSSPFGWQGRNPEIKFEDVGEPEIGFVLPNGSYTTSPALRAALGFTGGADQYFIFSRSTDKTLGQNKKDTKYIVDFTIKKRNYDILPAGVEVKITYTLKGRVNDAPYVGNLEYLTPPQHRKIRSDAIAFAYPEDWRSKIFNPRTQNAFLNYFTLPIGESPTRDEILPNINIDLKERSIIYNYITEFPLIAVSSGTGQAELTFGLEEVFEDDFKVGIVSSFLKYEFNADAGELLFYAFDDTRNESPLDYESVVNILRANGQQVVVKEVFSPKLLPSGFNRNDNTGSSWRWNYQHSKVENAYLIFGYIRD